MVKFRILGPVRLSVDDRSAEIGAAKIRGLLGILLLSANVAVPIDHIVERLWDTSSENVNGMNTVKGREPPPNPRKTLQSYVSKLRAVLDRILPSAIILTERGYYRLQVDATLVDYHRFRELVDEGRAAARDGDHPAAVSTLTAALALWQGDPLADVQSNWAQRTRDALITQEMLPAQYALLDARLALHQYAEVLAELRPLLNQYETDETLVALRMRAQAGIDGPGGLRAIFHSFRLKLRDLVDAEPSDWLIEQYRQLLRPAAPRPVLPPAAPPVAVPRTVVPQQLPRDITHFVGRTMLLRQLDDLFDSAGGQPPVVALHGGPGIGKTAVAICWAHRQQSRFPDGQLYADLNGFGPGPVTSPTAVLGEFLAALGWERDRLPVDSAERAAVLRRSLAGRRILVILDNALDAAQVRPLLAATASCPVLVTSRQSLSSPDNEGTRGITVAPLLEDEAYALLQRRISDTRRALDPVALHDLVALCQGLPLALRVAGEHVASRPAAPLPELVEHLRSDRRFLGVGHRGDTGDRTLRAVFSWSCDALPDEAERLFCLLGIHPSARISAPAAAALAGRPVADVEPLLDVLVGAHLLDQQGADSYRLHALVHFYAGDRAQQKMPPEARRAAVNRMLDWYLQSTIRAIEKVSPQRPLAPVLAPTTAISPLSFADHDRAMRWCTRERREILAAIRASVEHGFYGHTWRLLATFADVLNRSGDPGLLLDAHRAALDSSRLDGSRAGEAGNLNNLGTVHYNLGQHGEALRNFTEALAVFREVGDAQGEAMAQVNLGNTHLERGAHRLAVTAYEQAREIAEKTRDVRALGYAFHGLGKASQWRGDLDRADEHYQQALRWRIESADVRNQAITVEKLGELQLERGNARAAIRYAEDSLRMSRHSLDERKAAQALRIRALAQYRLGAHVEAIGSAQESISLCRRVSALRVEAGALEVLARAEYAVGDHVHAVECLNRAYGLLESLGDPATGRIAALAAELGHGPASIPGSRPADPPDRPAGSPFADPAGAPTERLR
jgi:tetratricopeptide (TPR) repeat protein/DNA-binding SARP family transcriptional activator